MNDNKMLNEAYSGVYSKEQQADTDEILKSCLLDIMVGVTNSEHDPERISDYMARIERLSIKQLHYLAPLVNLIKDVEPDLGKR